MGFKKAAEVLDALFEFAGGRDNYYYKVVASGTQLPAELRFDAVIIDLSSRMFSIYPACRTGHELVCFINKLVRDLAQRFGASEFFFCVDDRDFVTKAKAVEQAQRAQSNPCAPYVEQLALRDGTSTPLATYQFGLGALPSEYEKLMATPVLRRRWFVFVGDVVANYIQRPNPQKVSTVTVSGFRHCTCKSLCVGSQTSRVVKTAFFGKEDEAQPAPSTILTKDNPTLQIGLARCAAAATECHQHFASAHIDGELAEQSVMPTIEVGEAEGQCFYWVNKLIGNNQSTRILVSVNSASTTPTRWRAA
jgi:hypothetical protein